MAARCRQLCASHNAGKARCARHSPLAPPLQGGEAQALSPNRPYTPIWRDRIMAKQLPNPPKVGLVSLGCHKALVDSERLLTNLRADGYALSPSYDDAAVLTAQPREGKE